jgi:uncharacterized membrane protein YfcA
LRQRRVDLRSAGAFVAAALPGVVLGVFGADRLSRGWFDPLFGLLLGGMAALLTIAPNWRPSSRGGSVKRELVDSRGALYVWSFDMRLGLLGSVVVGIVSALFGIGGGPIQVPFLVAALNYPEHIATATSHAVLAATSLVATLIHAARGDFSADLQLTLATSLGALAGAPLGAHLSRFVPGRVLLRILAAMLAFIAARLIFSHDDRPDRRARADIAANARPSAPTSGRGAPATADTAPCSVRDYAWRGAAETRSSVAMLANPERSAA